MPSLGTKPVTFGLVGQTQPTEPHRSGQKYNYLMLGAANQKTRSVSQTAATIQARKNSKFKHLVYLQEKKRKHQAVTVDAPEEKTLWLVHQRIIFDYIKHQEKMGKVGRQKRCSPFHEAGK